MIKTTTHKFFKNPLIWNRKTFLYKPTYTVQICIDTVSMSFTNRLQYLKIMDIRKTLNPTRVNLFNIDTITAPIAVHTLIDTNPVITIVHSISYSS